MSLVPFFNFWTVKIKFIILVVIALSIVREFHQKTVALRLRNTATA